MPLGKICDERGVEEGLSGHMVPRDNAVTWCEIKVAALRDSVILATASNQAEKRYGCWFSACFPLFLQCGTPVHGRISSHLEYVFPLQLNLSENNSIDKSPL